MDEYGDKIEEGEQDIEVIFHPFEAVNNGYMERLEVERIRLIVVEDAARAREEQRVGLMGTEDADREED